MEPRYPNFCTIASKLMGNLCNVHTRIIDWFNNVFINHIYVSLCPFDFVDCLVATDVNMTQKYQILLYYHQALQ